MEKSLENHLAFTQIPKKEKFNLLSLAATATARSVWPPAPTRTDLSLAVCRVLFLTFVSDDRLSACEMGYTGNGVGPNGCVSIDACTTADPVYQDQCSSNVSFVLC